MLSLPDLQAKKILLLAHRDCCAEEIKFCNSNIKLYRDEKCADSISCHLVFGIFVIGNFSITTPLIRQCKEHGISLFFMRSNFDVYAEMCSVAEGHYELREKQYLLDEPRCVCFARALVANKIGNQAKIIQRLYKGKNKAAPYLEQLGNVHSLKKIRGIEGNFAREYFSLVFKDLGWYRRAPRTKEDIPNFLLDIGYTFLFHYVDSLLRLFGFDTYKGFYHQLFFRRKSLSCDLMEVFRPLIDHQLIKSWNLKQIDPKDFRFENGVFSFKKRDFNRKYADLWFDTIIGHRDDIYAYTVGYYRHLLNPDRYPFPSFKIAR